MKIEKQYDYENYEKYNHENYEKFGNEDVARGFEIRFQFWKLSTASLSHKKKRGNKQM